MNRNFSAQSIGLLAFTAALTLVPLCTRSPYVLNIGIFIGIHILLASSNRLILKTGLWFMGHAAFFAIGVYALLLARLFLGLNYWVAFPLAGIASGLVALGLGYATSRVKGVPFAIITIAFVEIVRLTIIKFGGGHPIKCPPPEALLTMNFNSKVHYYYFIMVLVIGSFVFLARIERSRIGGAIAAIAVTESLAESVGINTTRYRVVVMAASCFVAGLAGAFFAPYVEVVGYSTFTLTASILILFFVVIGGIDSLWGPVVGATFMTLLPEFLPGSAAVQNILNASIVLASLFFLPGGLITLPRVIRARSLRTLPQLIRQWSGPVVDWSHKRKS